MEARVDLVRTSLPAIDNMLIFHPASLLCILSMMNWKSLLFSLAWKMGKPNYLPKESLGLILRMVEQEEMVMSLQLEEKTTLDLV